MNYKVLGIMFYTLFWRERRRILRIWPQTLLPSVVTAVLYFMIFGEVLGSKIGSLENLAYIIYISPGIIIMSVINNSFANVVSSFYGIKFNHSVEEIMISPTPPYIIILAYVAGGIFRGMLTGVLVFCVALFFVGIQLELINFSMIALAFFMSSTLFSLGGFLNALHAQSFDDTSIFSSFILTPLVYLGGIFYNINSLSPFWKKIALMNPLFYVVDFTRAALTDKSCCSSLISFIGILFIIIVLYVICCNLLKRGYRIKC